jgi:hypothetical protein
MENQDSIQNGARKARARVAEASPGRLRSELAYETRRAVLIESQLAELRAGPPGGADPGSAIATLEAAVREREALAEAKRAELRSGDAVAALERRVARLRECLEGDRIDGEQEIVDLRARHERAIQRAQGELGELARRRRQCAARLRCAQCDGEGRVNRAHPVDETALAMARELRKLQRRREELLLLSGSHLNKKQPPR